MIAQSILNTFQKWIEEKLGIKKEVLSRSECETKIKERMKSCNIQDPQTYLEYLLNSVEEQKLIIETLIVPETWFFREKGSLNYLTYFIQQQTKSIPPHKVWRILSVGCASGEEPYSIAIKLFEQGLDPDHFIIDAIDISSIALSKAAEAVYTKNSFRSPDFAFRSTYFQHLDDNDCFLLKPFIKNRVTFYNLNVISPEFMLWSHHYDAIFCRNLMIYLTKESRDKLLSVFNRILLPEGIIFVGHAEAEFLRETGYKPIKYPKACAFQKVTKKKFFQNEIYKKDKRKNILKKNIPSIASIEPHKIIKEENDTKLPIKIQKETIEQDLLKKGLELANKGLLKESKEVCQECIANNPGNIEANFLMGTLYHAMADTAKAEEFFQKVVYLNPNHDEALVYLALLAEINGKMEKAELYKRRVLKALTLKNKQK